MTIELIPCPVAGEDPTDEQLDWIMRAAASDARARAAAANAELQATIVREVNRIVEKSLSGRDRTFLVLSE